jgi:hypothetical protein
VTAATQAEGPATTATILPTLSPDRPGAHAALTVAVNYSGGTGGVPAPVRSSLVRFPAGLTLDVPHLRACAAARLLAQGPSGCPAQSALGRGSALAVARTGAVLIEEHVALWAFLGPPRNGWATVQILGQGYTPVAQSMVVTGTMRADSAPYGEALSIPVPPIPSLPGASEVSLQSLSLTIGAHGARRRSGAANAVLVPARCPAGGLPFAAAFTYADGSQGSAKAAVPCVRAGAPPAVARRAPARKAHIARTIYLNETGHLHLVGKPQGFTLNEQGTATGTAAGSIYVRLTAVSSSRVTAAVDIYPHGGGAIVGSAAASYRTGGTLADFAGSMSITRGSGGYAHAHGSGLRFSGSIDRDNDAVTVQVSGSLSD